MEASDEVRGLRFQLVVLGSEQASETTASAAVKQELDDAHERVSLLLRVQSWSTHSMDPGDELHSRSNTTPRVDCEWLNFFLLHRHSSDT